MVVIRLPSVYLGTMTFGWRGQTSSFVDTQIATKMIEQFVNNYQTDDGIHHIDCARIYAGGDSEKILRDAMAAAHTTKSPAIMLGTKAHPSQPDGLSEKGLLQQLEKSFDALGVLSVLLSQWFIPFRTKYPSLNDSIFVWLRMSEYQSSATTVSGSTSTMP